ncbi:hypothetical protein D9M68_693000 [compost metagenome]
MNAFATVSEISLAKTVLAAGENSTFDRVVESVAEGSVIDATEIASLVILGLRYMSMGGMPFDCEKPKGEIYWTAKRLIDKQTKEMKKASGHLRDLHDGRAQGMIMAFFNVGLIDNDTYMQSFRRLEEISNQAKTIAGGAK